MGALSFSLDNAKATRGATTPIESTASEPTAIDHQAYRRERILETYYAYALTKAITLTADYQFFTNPAYNADRGPVHIFSGRLHGEF